MGKHSRCVFGVCDNNMRYPQLHKKHSNMDEETSNSAYSCLTDNSIKSSYVRNGIPA